MQKPVNTGGMTCPLFRKACAKVCHTCELWQPVRGQHPQRNETVDRFMCAFTATMLMTCTAAREVDALRASTDELRKESATRDAAAARAMRFILTPPADTPPPQLPGT